MTFLGRNAVAIALLILVAAAFLYERAENRSLLTKIDALRSELLDRADSLDQADERIGENMLKLQKEGYIKADDFSDVAGRVLAATVAITAKNEVVGSGFFVRPDGYLATAEHVIRTAGDNLRVRTASGEREAKIVATDASADIAILKVNGNYTAVELGYFENIAVGESIGIVGYTKRAEPLVHSGVVSGRGGGVFSFHAFVNKGNSGGPVFSATTGRVIGIIRAREQDVPTEKFIQLPENYSSGFSLGGIDPIRMSVELHNETLKTIGDVSQVGIGFATAADAARALLRGIR